MTSNLVKILGIINALPQLDSNWVGISNIIVTKWFALYSCDFFLALYFPFIFYICNFLLIIVQKFHLHWINEFSSKLSGSYFFCFKIFLRIQYLKVAFVKCCILSFLPKKLLKKCVKILLFQTMGFVIGIILN